MHRAPSIPYTIQYCNEVKNSCIVSANLTRERPPPLPNLLVDDCGGTLGLISGCLINRKRIAKENKTSLPYIPHHGETCCGSTRVPTRLACCDYGHNRRENARPSVWNPSVAEERLRLYIVAAALIKKKQNFPHI